MGHPAWLAYELFLGQKLMLGIPDADTSPIPILDARRINGLYGTIIGRRRDG